jgi:uncharacterized protein (TIGR03067 family)
MRSTQFLSFILFAAIAGAASGTDVPATDDPAKDELDRLRGMWQCSKMMADGRPMEFPEGRPATVTFEGEKVMFGQKDAKGEENQGPATPFKIAPTRDPKEIDIGDKGEIKGIYAVDGDTLKVMHIIAKRGQPVPKLDRPKEFKPMAGDGYVYTELKRVKR